MGITEDILANTQRSIQLSEDILAKTNAILNIVSVAPNQPPQYTGPTQIVGTVGVPVQLQGVDANGDTIVWSVATNEWAIVSSGGQLTPSKATPTDANGVAIPQQVTVTLDDGKP